MSDLWIALLVIAVVAIVSRVYVMGDDGVIDRRRRNQMGIVVVVLVAVAIAFLA